MQCKVNGNIFGDDKIKNESYPFKSRTIKKAEI